MINYMKYSHKRLHYLSAFSYFHEMFWLRVLVLFILIWNITVPEKVLRYLKGQSFRIITEFSPSTKFRGTSPMHSSSQMSQICIYSLLKYYKTPSCILVIARAKICLLLFTYPSAWFISMGRDKPTSTGHQGLAFTLSLPRGTVQHRG